METLPVEIRLQILSYLTPTGHVFYITKFVKPGSNLDTPKARSDFTNYVLRNVNYMYETTTPDVQHGLLTVSKTITAEYLELLYEQNAFEFKDDESFAFFLQTVNTVHLRLIRRVSLTYHRNPDANRVRHLARLMRSQWFGRLENLEAIQIEGVGRGCLHYRPAPVSMYNYDPKQWMQSHYDVVRAILDMAPKLVNGEVYCNTAFRATRIFPCGYQYCEQLGEEKVDVVQTTSDQERWARIKARRDALRVANVERAMIASGSSVD